MDWQVIAATFGLIFLAELGDKTQIAAFALSSRGQSAVSVFIGACLALFLVTLLGVLAGALVGRLVPERLVEIGSALLFLGVGSFLLIRAIFFHAP